MRRDWREPTIASKRPYWTGRWSYSVSVCWFNPSRLTTGQCSGDACCGRQVLYLADNAGETVFDRVLIEALGVPVVYAVKGGPVLNDATVEDALAAGLDRVAEIIPVNDVVTDAQRKISRPVQRPCFSLDGY
jgi:hypothetical protein